MLSRAGLIGIGLAAALALAGCASVQPGTRVMLNQPTVVEYRDGRYDTVAATSVAVVPAPGMRQTIYGRVTDVDRDGEIRVKTDRGSFAARFGSAEGLFGLAEAA